MVLIWFLSFSISGMSLMFILNCQLIVSLACVNLSRRSGGLYHWVRNYDLYLYRKWIFGLNVERCSKASVLPSSLSVNMHGIWIWRNGENRFMFYFYGPYLFCIVPELIFLKINLPKNIPNSFLLCAECYTLYKSKHIQMTIHAIFGMK